MGADGGVCWFTLKEPYSENEIKIRELLPYPLLHFDDSRPANLEFSMNNKDPVLEATFGSFQKYDLGDLYTMVYEIDIEYDSQLTLYDILLDAYTKPAWERIKRLTKLEEVLLHTYLGWSWYYANWEECRECFLYKWEEQNLENNAILQMTIEDWSSQIKSCIDIDSYRSCYTWT